MSMSGLAENQRKTEYIISELIHVKYSGEIGESKRYIAHSPCAEYRLVRMKAPMPEIKRNARRQCISPAGGNHNLGRIAAYEHGS